MAAAKQGVYAIEVDPRQLKDLLGVLRSLDKETQDEVRTRAQPLSQRLAGQLMMSANQAPAPATKPAEADPHAALEKQLDDLFA